MNKEITTKEIYELVDRTRQELSTSITRLESKFDTLEAGRLTKLEGDFASVKARHDLMQRVVFGAVGIILVAVVGALLSLILIK